MTAGEWRVLALENTAFLQSFGIPADESDGWEVLAIFGEPIGCNDLENKVGGLGDWPRL